MDGPGSVNKQEQQTTTTTATTIEEMFASLLYVIFCRFTKLSAGLWIWHGGNFGCYDGLSTMWDMDMVCGDENRCKRS